MHNEKARVDQVGGAPGNGVSVHRPPGTTARRADVVASDTKASEASMPDDIGLGTGGGQHGRRVTGPQPRSSTTAAADGRSPRSVRLWDRRPMPARPDASTPRRVTEARTPGAARRNCSKSARGPMLRRRLPPGPAPSGAQLTTITCWVAWSPADTASGPSTLGNWLGVFVGHGGTMMTSVRPASLTGVATGSRRQLQGVEDPQDSSTLRPVDAGT